MKRKTMIAAILITICLAWALQLPAQEPSNIERHIRHELVMLRYYGVFDWLQFKVDGGNNVTLMGDVTRPTLKADAERAVKRVEGVNKIENKIEVLPVSPNDDRIRLNVYRAIYYNPSFTRYAIRAVPPIHIIVRNGDVRLVGLVATEADKTLARLQANGVAGVFSVTDELEVEE